MHQATTDEDMINGVEEAALRLTNDDINNHLIQIDAERLTPPILRDLIHIYALLYLPVECVTTWYRASPEERQKWVDAAVP